MGKQHKKRRLQRTISLTVGCLISFGVKEQDVQHLA